MTAIPQMVALFNGVGGGAVALIAWSEFRTTDAFAGEPLYVVIASLFGAVVGSVSFWGSLVAFGKLQEILPGRPLGLGPGPAGGEPAAACGCRRVRDVGRDRRCRAVDGRAAGARRGARRDGGAADRRGRHARGDLVAERADRALGRCGRPGAGQHGDDRRRDDRRCVRDDPDQPHGHRHEPLDPGHRRGWIRRDVDGARRRTTAADRHGHRDHAPPTPPSGWPTPRR